MKTCFTYNSNLFCSFSKGRILSSTIAYLILAFTQAAKGAAATDALLATFGSNESRLSASNRLTASLLSGDIRCTSNVLIQQIHSLINSC